LRIEWSRPAIIDREDIAEYIARESPRQAAHVDAAIASRADDLMQFHGRGRPGRIPGTRELVLVDLPYLIVYHVEKEAIIVLRILHTARQWPPDP
jgi:toxin ParE1/3/4